MSPLPTQIHNIYLIREFEWRPPSAQSPFASPVETIFSREPCAERCTTNADFGTEQPFSPACNPKNGLLSLFMYKTTLLVSRDERLQETRAVVLRKGGYHTMSSTNMTSALQLAGRCQMSIIGHTFTPNEQDEFIDRVYESSPSVYRVCLHFSLTQPQELLKVVGDCFAGQPGARGYV